MSGTIRRSLIFDENNDNTKVGSQVFPHFSDSTRLQNNNQNTNLHGEDDGQNYVNHDIGHHERTRNHEEVSTSSTVVENYDLYVNEVRAIQTFALQQQRLVEQNLRNFHSSTPSECTSSSNTSISQETAAPSPSSTQETVIDDDDSQNEVITNSTVSTNNENDDDDTNSQTPLPLPSFTRNETEIRQLNFQSTSIASSSSTMKVEDKNFFKKIKKNSAMNTEGASLIAASKVQQAHFSVSSSSISSSNFVSKTGDVKNNNQNSRAAVVSSSISTSSSNTQNANNNNNDWRTTAVTSALLDFEPQLVSRLLDWKFNHNISSIVIQVTAPNACGLVRILPVSTSLPPALHKAILQSSSSSSHFTSSNQHYEDQNNSYLLASQKEVAHFKEICREYLKMGKENKMSGAGFVANGNDKQNENAKGPESTTNATSSTALFPPLPSSSSTLPSNKTKSKQQTQTQQFSSATIDPMPQISSSPNSTSSSLQPIDLPATANLSRSIVGAILHTLVVASEQCCGMSVLRIICHDFSEFSHPSTLHNANNTSILSDLLRSSTNNNANKTKSKNKNNDNNNNLSCSRSDAFFSVPCVNPFLLYGDKVQNIVIKHIQQQNNNNISASNSLTTTTTSTTAVYKLIDLIHDNKALRSLTYPEQWIYALCYSVSEIFMLFDGHDTFCRKRHADKIIASFPCFFFSTENWKRDTNNNKNNNNNNSSSYTFKNFRDDILELATLENFSNLIPHHSRHSDRRLVISRLPPRPFFEIEKPNKQHPDYDHDIDDDDDEDYQHHSKNIISNKNNNKSSKPQETKTDNDESASASFGGVYSNNNVSRFLMFLCDRIIRVKQGKFIPFVHFLCSIAEMPLGVVPIDASAPFGLTRRAAPNATTQQQQQPLQTVSNNNNNYHYKNNNHYFFHNNKNNNNFETTSSTIYAPMKMVPSLQPGAESIFYGFQRRGETAAETGKHHHQSHFSAILQSYSKENVSSSSSPILKLSPSQIAELSSWKTKHGVECCVIHVFGNEAKRVVYITPVQTKQKENEDEDEDEEIETNASSPSPATTICHRNNNQQQSISPAASSDMTSVSPSLQKTRRQTKSKSDEDLEKLMCDFYSDEDEKDDDEKLPVIVKNNITSTFVVDSSPPIVDHHKVQEAKTPSPTKKSQNKSKNSPSSICFTVQSELPPSASFSASSSHHHHNHNHYNNNNNYSYKKTFANSTDESSSTTSSSIPKTNELIAAALSIAEVFAQVPCVRVIFHNLWAFRDSNFTICSATKEDPFFMSYVMSAVKNADRLIDLLFVNLAAKTTMQQESFENNNNKNNKNQNNNKNNNKNESNNNTNTTSPHIAENHWIGLMIKFVRACIKCLKTCHKNHLEDALRLLHGFRTPLISFQEFECGFLSFFEKMKINKQDETKNNNNNENDDQENDDEENSSTTHFYFFDNGDSILDWLRSLLDGALYVWKDKTLIKLIRFLITVCVLPMRPTNETISNNDEDEKQNHENENGIAKDENNNNHRFYKHRRNRRSSNTNNNNNFEKNEKQQQLPIQNSLLQHQQQQQQQRQPQPQVRVSYYHSSQQYGEATTTTTTHYSTHNTRQNNVNVLAADAVVVGRIVKNKSLNTNYFQRDKINKYYQQNTQQ